MDRQGKEVKVLRCLTDRPTDQFTSNERKSQASSSYSQQTNQHVRRIKVMAVTNKHLAAVNTFHTEAGRATILHYLQQRNCPTSRRNRQKGGGIPCSLQCFAAGSHSLLSTELSSMPSDQQTHIPDRQRPGTGSKCKCVRLQEEEEEEEEEKEGGENPCKASSGGRQLQRANEVCPAGVLSADCLLPMLWRSNYKHLCLTSSLPALGFWHTSSSPSTPPDLPFPLFFSLRHPSSFPHPMLSKICWRSEVRLSRWRMSVHQL